MSSLFYFSFQFVIIIRKVARGHSSFNVPIEVRGFPHDNSCYKCCDPLAQPVIEGVYMKNK